MGVGGKILRSPMSRVFLLEDRAGPATVPTYQGMAKAQGFTWDQGDRTPVRLPSDDQYDRFLIVDKIRGERGLPTLPLQVRYNRDISEMFRLMRKGCPVDLQVHLGLCQDPRDFNGGWDKILVLEDADLTAYSTDDLGALEQGEDAIVNELVNWVGADAYELKRIRFSELGEAEIVQQIIDVLICDARTCGECGIASDGCQVVFALTLAAGGSPGLPAELIFTQDGGATLGQTNIATLPANQDPTAMACVGVNLVVVSNVACSLYYAPIADILLGVAVWVPTAVGLTCAAGAPNAIFSLGSTFTWIVGDGGYVYFTQDPMAGAGTTQDAGVAAAGNPLNDIHGIDALNLVAVGDVDTIIVTVDGGVTWAATAATPGGGNYTCVWMKTINEWFVGDDAGGLYYTRDGGVTWVAKAFPGSGGGAIRDIHFPTPTVGYMAHDIAGPAGRILRTIDGGYSWYLAPEDAGVNIQANDQISSVMGCVENPNIVFAGGLADDGEDGIFLKGA